MKIQSLWRYPVKSLMGESLEELSLDSRGVVGDRQYAIINADGKIGSGKDTRRFARIDGLFSLAAMTKENGLEIVFPNGNVESEFSSGLNAALSTVLGETVQLSREESISHFDAGAVHILTTSSLARLKAASTGSQIDVRRFRANIVLETSDEVTDDTLIGRTLRLGEVVLEITAKTERCRMVTLEQGDLNNEPKILKAISQAFGLDFGVYAKVLKPGRIDINSVIELD